MDLPPPLAATGGMNVGDWVKLQGLQSRPELNGTRAKLLRWSAPRARWQVLAVAAADVVCVKREKFEQVQGESDDPDAAGCARLLAKYAAACYDSYPKAEQISGQPLFPGEEAERVKEGLGEKGYCVIDGLLPQDVLTTLQEEASTLYSSGAFQQDGNSLEVRSDRCFHLHPDGHPPGASTLAAVARRMQAVVSHIGGGEVRITPDLQLAVYDGDRAFYRPHRDVPPAQTPEEVKDSSALDSFLVSSMTGTRAITFILYLNPTDWKEEDGGALRLYLGAATDDAEGSTATEKVDLQPLGGRLVVFDAKQVLHEVRPCHRRRIALSLWAMRQ